MSIIGHINGGRSRDKPRWRCGTDKEGFGAVASGVHGAKGERRMGKENPGG